MAGLKISDLVFAGLRNRRQAAEPPRPENPLFDRAFYADAYPHVVKGGVDLYVHYTHFGCRNAYDPNPYFRSGWYRGQYPDVTATGANPLDHYLDRGVIEGRNPGPDFSTWLYLILYPDVRAAGMNPLLHYLSCGRAEGRLAPPVCLVSSLRAMRAAAAPDDMPDTADTQATVEVLRMWLDKLAARKPASRG